MTDEAKLTLIVFLIAFVQNVSSSALFTFPDPVKYDQQCGLENLVGQWSVGGTITVQEFDFNMFEPKVVIYTRTEEICTIDLTTCDAGSSLPMTDVCACTGKMGDVHTLYVRQRPRLSHSRSMLKARLPTKNVCNPENVGVDIGLLPFVYYTPAPVYQVNGEEMTSLSSVQSVYVKANTFMTLKFCVHNLLPGFVLNITAGNQETRVINACVEMTKQYTFNEMSYHDLILTFAEMTGCRRSESYSVQVRLQEPTYGHQTIKNKECVADSPYLPEILPPGTCASHNSSCGVEIVTLSNGKQLLCETEIDEGEWIYIQRRSSGDVDFHRTWTDYVDGFGELNGNFWFGLESIHRLCGNANLPCELRVQMVYKNKDYYAVYTNFHVAGGWDHYRLKISGYYGDAGDAMIGSHNINNAKFGTKDNDNDNNRNSNCAHSESGGWWYNACAWSNLNAIWGSKINWKGLVWFPLTGKSDSVSYSALMVRQRVPPS